MYREAYGCLPRVRGLLVPFTALHLGSRRCRAAGQLLASSSGRQLPAPWHCTQILAAAGPQPQRYVEVRAVAEQVHVKVRPSCSG